MLDELTQVASATVEMARAAGAQDAWVSASRSRSTELSLRDATLEKAQESTSRSLSITVYVEGRYSTHTTTDMRPDRLKGFIDEAVALTRALEPDENRSITDPSLFADLPTTDLDLVDPALLALTTEQRMDMLAGIARGAGEHEKAISTEAELWDEHSGGAAVSSNGFEGSWQQTNLWLGSQVTVQGEGDKRPRGGVYTQTVHLADQPTPAWVGEDAMRQALLRLGSVQGPTLRAVMVVDPRVSGSLLRRLLSGNRPRSLQQKQSFWRDMLGEAMVSEVLSVTDEPLIVRGLSSRHFDGEGIAARALPIIEAGVVRNYYMDTYYGKKSGLKPTTGGPSNLVVGLGARTCDEIIADLDDGIYITGGLGGNADSTTGDFSMGCQGHRVRGGQVAEAINEMNITGNLPLLFKDLIEVGSDPWPYSSLRSPTLVFDGVQFSGG